MIIFRLKEIVLHRTRNLFLSSDFIFKFTSLYREQQKHLDFIYSSAEKVDITNTFSDNVTLFERYIIYCYVGTTTKGKRKE